MQAVIAHVSSQPLGQSDMYTSTEELLLSSTLGTLPATLFNR